MPQVLATTIDELKAFIKEEKDVSSEVSSLGHFRQSLDDKKSRQRWPYTNTSAHLSHPALPKLSNFPQKQKTDFHLL